MQGLFIDSGLSRLDFKELCKFGNLRVLNRGQTLLEEGKEMNFLSVLCSGTLEARRFNHITSQSVRIPLMAKLTK